VMLFCYHDRYTALARGRAARSALHRPSAAARGEVRLACGGALRGPADFAACADAPSISAVLGQCLNSDMTAADHP
jgi:hypothetical protein